MHVVEQPALTRTDRAQIKHVLATAIPADVDTPSEYFDDAVLGEQIGDVVRIEVGSARV
jgi:hypothetical protein